MQLKLTSKGCGGLSKVQQRLSALTPQLPHHPASKRDLNIVIKLLFTIYTVSQIILTSCQHGPGRRKKKKTSSGNLAAEDAAESLVGDDFTREHTNVKSHRAWKTRLQAPPAGQSRWDSCTQSKHSATNRVHFRIWILRRGLVKLLRLALSSLCNPSCP